MLVMAEASPRMTREVTSAPAKAKTGFKNRLSEKHIMESMTKNPAPELTPIVLGLARELFITP